MLNSILQTEANLFISAVAVINGAASKAGISTDGLDAGFLRDYADGSIRVRSSFVAAVVTLPFVVFLAVATALACALALVCSWISVQSETQVAAQSKGRMSVTTLGYITLALVALQLALRHS